MAVPKRARIAKRYEYIADKSKKESVKDSDREITGKEHEERLRKLKEIGLLK